jgi:hypothetical protein
MNGQLHAPAALPTEKATGTHCIGSWVGPRPSLDIIERRKIFWPCRESNPGRAARSRRYTYWAILTLKMKMLDFCICYIHILIQASGLRN